MEPKNDRGEKISFLETKGLKSWVSGEKHLGESTMKAGVFPVGKADFLKISDVH